MGRIPRLDKAFLKDIYEIGLPFARRVIGKVGQGIYLVNALKARFRGLSSQVAGLIAGLAGQGYRAAKNLGVPPVDPYGSAAQIPTNPYIQSPGLIDNRFRYKATIRWDDPDTGQPHTRTVDVWSDKELSYDDVRDKALTNQFLGEKNKRYKEGPDFQFVTVTVTFVEKRY